MRALAQNAEAELARVEVMRTHMRSIAQETQTSHNLLDARIREAATESHLKVLAEREMGKLSSDIEGMASRQAELKDKVSFDFLYLYHFVIVIVDLGVVECDPKQYLQNDGEGRGVPTADELEQGPTRPVGHCRETKRRRQYHIISNCFIIDVFLDSNYILVY